MKKNTFANIVIITTYIATLIGSFVTSYQLKKLYIKNKTSAGKQMLVDAGAGLAIGAIFYGTLFGIYKIADMRAKAKKKKKSETEMNFSINEDAE